MATIEKLPVNFNDDIIDTTISDKRRYNLINNSDGTVSLDDVTTYTQVGDNFGKEQVNKINGTINQLIDATSNINNTSDSEKSVLYAETSGVAELANNATNAVNANKAENANVATRAINADNATRATNAVNATNATNADNAANATNAQTANKALLADNATNAVNAQTADSAKAVENNFILRNQATLTFNNSNVCTITDNRITANSLADVYFTQDSIVTAEKAVITVETYAGKVELMAGRRPEGTIKASIMIRVVE